MDRISLEEKIAELENLLENDKDVKVSASAANALRMRIDELRRDAEKLPNNDGLKLRFALLSIGVLHRLQRISSQAEEFSLVDKYFHLALDEKNKWGDEFSEPEMLLDLQIAEWEAKHTKTIFLSESDELKEAEDILRQINEEVLTWKKNEHISAAGLIKIHILWIRVQLQRIFVFGMVFERRKNDEKENSLASFNEISRSAKKEFDSEHEQQMPDLLVDYYLNCAETHQRIWEYIKEDTELESFDRFIKQIKSLESKVKDFSGIAHAIIIEAEISMKQDNHAGAIEKIESRLGDIDNKADYFRICYARDILGQCYQKTGDINKALKIYEDALKIIKYNDLEDKFIVPGGLIVAIKSACEQLKRQLSPK